MRKLCVGSLRGFRAWKVIWWRDFLHKSYLRVFVLYDHGIFILDDPLRRHSWRKASLRLHRRWAWLYIIIRLGTAWRPIRPWTRIQNISRLCNVKRLHNGFSGLGHFWRGRRWLQIVHRCRGSSYDAWFSFDSRNRAIPRFGHKRRTWLACRLGAPAPPAPEEEQEDQQH